ncbi:MAG: hypothetical protein HQ556_06540 [Candidatus Marinimicrobia bacterium]|nr:hypothetical protein [Candidatus Neomarinimicrobiota bacterium]
MIPWASNPLLYGWPYQSGLSFLTHQLWLRSVINYDLLIHENNFPTPNPFPVGSQISISARDLLISSGILTTPTQATATLRTWGFFIDHIESFRPSPGFLRIVDSVENWDSRLKGLFAERIGVGLTGYLLWRYYDILHITDAGNHIGRMNFQSNHPFHGMALAYSGAGAYKPDFFCLTNSGESVIAESKGTIGPPGNLTTALTDGKQQVNSVHPLGVPLRNNVNRLVFGTNLRLEGDTVRSGKDSGVTINDPNENNQPVEIRLDLTQMIIDGYSKIFNYVGRWDLSIELAERRISDWVNDIHEKDIFTYKNVNYAEITRVPSGRVGLRLDIFKLLLSSNKSESINQIGELLEDTESQKFTSEESRLILPCGVIFEFDRKGNRNKIYHLDV